MKKTSYIIFTLIGLLIVVAFLAPVLIFKKVDIKFNILKNSGEPVRIETEMFVSLSVENNNSLSVNSDHAGESSPLTVRIYENDTIRKPYIVMDRSWADNVTVTNDTTGLNLNIDLHSLVPDKDLFDNRRVLYGESDRVIADIYMPRNMLHKIKWSGIYYELYDFDNELLDLSSSTSLTAFNSRFGQLINN